jgi:hypothetical protein
MYVSANFVLSDETHLHTKMFPYIRVFSLSLYYSSIYRSSKLYYLYSQGSSILNQILQLSIREWFRYREIYWLKRPLKWHGPVSTPFYFSNIDFSHTRLSMRMYFSGLIMTHTVSYNLQVGIIVTWIYPDHQQSVDRTKSLKTSSINMWTSFWIKIKHSVYENSLQGRRSDFQTATRRFWNLHKTTAKQDNRGNKGGTERCGWAVTTLTSYSICTILETEDCYLGRYFVVYLGPSSHNSKQTVFSFHVSPNSRLIMILFMLLIISVFFDASNTEYNLHLR